MRHAYVELNDKNLISDITNKINTAKFVNRKFSEPEEARLVIDFVRNDGNIDTFYANKTHLLTADSTQSAAFDKQLHQALKFFAKN